MRGHWVGNAGERDRASKTVAEAARQVLYGIWFLTHFGVPDAGGLRRRLSA